MNLRKREKERKVKKENAAVKAKLFDDNDDSIWTF